MTWAEQIKLEGKRFGYDVYRVALQNQTHRMIKDDKVTVFFEDGSSLTFRKVLQLED